MARITVEDCLVKIPNRFQLVLALKVSEKKPRSSPCFFGSTTSKPGMAVSLTRMLADLVATSDMVKRPTSLPAHIREAFSLPLSCATAPGAAARRGTAAPSGRWV